MSLGKKKKSKAGLILALVLGAGILALGAFLIFRPNAATLNSATVTKASIETYYTFSGNIASKNMQNVMASSVLQISELNVQEGDRVEKDTVLFKTSQGQEIKAQIAGTVSKIYVEADQQVMAGAQLCDIYDFDSLKVTVKVDEYDLSSIAKDKEVAVSIGALDKTLTGTVSSISDTATTQQGVAYFSAVIDLPKDEAIKVGMTAEAKILNKQVADVLTIPMKAISFDDLDNPYVLVKDANGATKNQSIKVGLNDGKLVEITEGLTEGQTIYYAPPSKSSNQNMMGRGGPTRTAN